MTIPAFIADSSLVNAVHPSPNHGVRTRPLDALVLHYTGMPTASGALDRLCDPGPEVSAHYLIAEDGYIAQLAPEDRRAWHAGRSFWQGETDMNSASIGIEIANAGHDAAVDGCPPPFPPKQIEAVIALCRDIIARNAIAPERVLGHSDIAPGRKRDPGEAFPWAQLAAAGVGLFPSLAEAGVEPGNLTMGRGATGAPVVNMQTILANIGYGLTVTGVYDAETETIVTAFQRRYRPQVCNGVADAATAALIEALSIILHARAARK